MRKILFPIAALLAAWATPVHAGIIPVSVTVLPESGNFRWTYSIVLPGNMKLQSGDYFTIYDFAGLVAGSDMVSATGPDASYAAHWSFSSNMTGVTPERLSPDDSPIIPNLTWTYNGPEIDLPGTITLGNFSAVSVYDQEGPSFLTGRNPRSADGVIDANITETLVPVARDQEPYVPEPGTLALAGLGLPLLGLRRLWRRKTA